MKNRSFWVECLKSLHLIRPSLHFATFYVGDVQTFISTTDSRPAIDRTTDNKACGSKLHKLSKIITCSLRVWMIE